MQSVLIVISQTFFSFLFLDSDLIGLEYILHLIVRLIQIKTFLTF